ncbi:NERD domain-containing protein [Arthrobacter sp. lap29]|uniref:nuclease-related domain-containing DEAD/DEAH box helicase n=1 Tax=Arthrobacter sp. lap29 TaxID=3056122 RepID=UPI0028F71DC7|nr:NERD domain-containing protein [Arthrobacter sp. lap29]
MRLIPPLEFINPKNSRAERRIAELLDKIPSDDAVAYHSVHLPAHETKRMGEADFVVLWNGAVIVVEVKGGRVSRVNGLWQFTNRFGQTNAKPESPWQQAQGAMFALRTSLSAQVDDFINDIALVVTPDQDLPSDPEWGSWEWAGPADIRTPELFKRVLDRSARKARTNPRNGTLNPAGNMAGIRRVLRRDFDRIRRLVDEEGRISGEMTELFGDQARSMEVLSENSRVRVEGGAGTGKTLLGIEWARRFSDSGYRTAFTCKSPRLREYASRSLAESQVFVLPPEHLISQGPFDALVIDEGQDLINTDDLAVLDESLTGGLEQGRWWMFLDNNNQAHVDGSFDDDSYAILREWAPVTAKLRDNVRNTGPIIDWIQLHLGSDLGIPRVGAGPKVKTVRSRPNDHKRFRELVEDWLKYLHHESVTIGNIQIITCAATPGASALPLSSSGSTLTYTSEIGTISVATPAQFKGLESNHVLVVDLDDLDSSEAEARAYVALTRASVSLWVALGDNAWNVMQSISVEQILKRAH